MMASVNYSMTNSRRMNVLILWTETYDSEAAFVATMISLAVGLCAMIFLLVGWLLDRRSHGENVASQSSDLSSKCGDNENVPNVYE